MRNLGEPCDQTIIAHRRIYGLFARHESSNSVESDRSANDKRRWEIDKNRQQINLCTWFTRVHAKYRWNQHLYKDDGNL